MFQRRRFAPALTFRLSLACGLLLLPERAPAQGVLGGFSYVRELPDPFDPAIRPGSVAGARNLEAFARLLAIVRFFHPSDEGARCDWNRFAVAGVERVEPAADPRELAARLRALFAPVAPTVRIYPVRDEAPLTPPPLLPPNGDDSKLRRVQWRHYGVQLDLKAEPGRRKPIFASERIDDRTDLGWGNLAQSVPAGPLRGRKVRLVAAVDAEVGADGRAQLWLRVDRPGGQRGFFDNMADRPIREPGWREVEIVGTIDPDAESIALGLAFASGSRGGRVRIDDVRLESVDEGEPVRARLENADFSRGEAKAQPPGWTFPYESVRAGYRLGLLTGPACRQGGCAEIEAGPIAYPPFPAPAETYGLDLPGGVRAEVPIALYADARGTLPHGSEGVSCVPPHPAGSAGAASPASSRSERLAALLLAWGAIDRFRPYTPEDGAPAVWSESLRQALPEAMGAPDDRSFLRVFRRLLFDLADDNAQIVRQDLLPTHRLPIEWRFVDWRLLYVTAVAPGVTEVKVGDLVGTVDGPLVFEHPILQGREVSAATPEGRRGAAAQRYLFGEPDSEVRLAVQSPGEFARGATLRRSLPAEAPVASPKLSPLAEPSPGILYLDLARLNDGDFQAALPRLAQAHGLIFDLRAERATSNALPSHLIDRTARGPRLLLPVRLRPDGPPLDWLETFWTLGPLEPHLSARCAFLLGESSRGYAETLLAMIEHEHRCELVGSRSAGMNGTLNVMDLPGGFQATFTGLKILKPDGSRHYGLGVEPTLTVDPTPQGIAAGKDEVLEAALELLRR